MRRFAAVSAVQVVVLACALTLMAKAGLHGVYRIVAALDTGKGSSIGRAAEVNQRVAGSIPALSASEADFGKGASLWFDST